jgi:hypothetical protein
MRFINITPFLSEACGAGFVRDPWDLQSFGFAVSRISDRLAFGRSMRLLSLAYGQALRHNAGPKMARSRRRIERVFLW